MNKYRVHVKGRFGRLIEMVELLSESDDDALRAVMDDLVFTRTAEIWHGTRLVSHVDKNPGIASSI